MKRVFLLIFVLVVSTLSFSQTKMIINKYSGLSDSLNLSDIKSITFKVVSPVGSTGKVVFVSDRSGSNQLWSVNTDGTGLKKLTNSSLSNKFWPKWSPDGSKIVYSACDCNPGQGFGAKIYIINTDGVPLDTVPTTTELVGVCGLAWTRDGGSIMYLENISCGQRIRKVNIATRADSLVWDESDTQNFPDMNPINNNKILFTSSHCGGYANIKLYDRTLNQSTDITPYDVLNEDFARWSSDGMKIIFQEDSAGGNWGPRIGIMNSDGSGRIRINSCKGQVPVFSFAGSNIIFSRPKNDDVTTGKYNIWIMAADGTNLIQLTTGDFNEVTPDVH